MDRSVISQLEEELRDVLNRHGVTRYELWLLHKGYIFLIGQDMPQKARLFYMRELLNEIIGKPASPEEGS